MWRGQDIAGLFPRIRLNGDPGLMYSVLATPIGIHNKMGAVIEKTFHNAGTRNFIIIVGDFYQISGHIASSIYCATKWYYLLINNKDGHRKSQILFARAGMLENTPRGAAAKNISAVSSGIHGCLFFLLKDCREAESYVRFSYLLESGALRCVNLLLKMREGNVKSGFGNKKESGGLEGLMYLFEK